MAIQPTLKKSFIAWNLAYLIITGGLGAWGGYDYWVTIPENEQRAAEWDALVTENQDLTNKAQTGIPLSVEEKNRYEEILLILETTYQNTAPQPPSTYDRPLNFWVYFVGCGVLGTPWFLWKLLTQRRLCVGLNDDGDLIDGDKTFPAATISGIDMSKWMSKSLAKVSVEGVEAPFALDDYVYQDAYLVVGALAHRFDPEGWTEEAKPIKAAAEPEEDPETPANEPPADPTEESPPDAG